MKVNKFMMKSVSLIKQKDVQGARAFANICAGHLNSFIDMLEPEEEIREHKVFLNKKGAEVNKENDNKSEKQTENKKDEN